MNQTANQIKEGEIKTTNFTIDQWNHARKINAIEIYSTHNEGKSVVAERFIRTLKNKIYNYMTSVSKNVYIDKLNDIVDKHNKTYHSTINVHQAVDVKPSTYIDSSKKLIDENPKLKIGDNAIISKYRKCFWKKVSLQIGVKKLLWLKKLKLLRRGHVLWMILTEKKLLELFTKQVLKNK